MNLKVSFKNVFLYFSNRFSQKYSTKCVHLNFKTLLFKYPPTMRKNEWTWKEINWMKLNRAHVECKAKQGWTKINALWWMNYILVHCLNDNPELRDSRCLLARLLPATSICFKTNVWLFSWNFYWTQYCREANPLGSLRQERNSSLGPRIANPTARKLRLAAS